MVDHISDLQWDRLLASELPAEAREAVRAHADQCPACASRLRELIAERDTFQLRSLELPVAPASLIWQSPAQRRKI